MPGTPEDLTKVITVHLLSRLVDLLPEGSFEQLQIKGSLVGLSTPEVFGNVPPGLPPLRYQFLCQASQPSRPLARLVNTDVRPLRPDDEGAQLRRGARSLSLSAHPRRPGACRDGGAVESAATAASKPSSGRW